MSHVVPLETVQNAVKALLAFHRKKHTETPKTELIETEDYLTLQIALNFAPERTLRKTVPLQLPHPFMEDDMQVCLLTKDPQREYKDLLQAKEVKCVQRVVGMEKLKTKFKQYESRRILCGEYDMFLADDRILHLLPQYLGKVFFEKKKMPVPVKLKRVDLNKELQGAIRATYLNVAAGSVSTIKVGRTTQSVDELVANVAAIIPEAVSHLPRKWRGVQGLYLKTSDSIAFPLFKQLPALHTSTPKTTEAAPATETSATTASSSSSQSNDQSNSNSSSNSRTTKTKRATTDSSTSASAGIINKKRKTVVASV